MSCDQKMVQLQKRAELLSESLSEVPLGCFVVVVRGLNMWMVCQDGNAQISDLLSHLSSLQTGTMAERAQKIIETANLSESAKKRVEMLV